MTALVPPRIPTCHPVVLGLAWLLAACGHETPAPHGAPTAATAPIAATPAVRVLSSRAAISLASSAAVAADGTLARVWVEKADGPAPPQLFVQLGDAAPRELTDASGPFSIDPESPPKLAFSALGDLYLAYQVTKPDAPHQGWLALRVVHSTDRGGHWSPPSSVADDGRWGAYRSDHALHVAADGRVHLAWLDERQERHSRVRTASSADHGATWSANVVIEDSPPCDCCRVALTSLANGRLVLAWRKVYDGDRRDLAAATSADGGRSWSAPVNVHRDDWQVDACPDAGPSIAASAAGTLHVAWWTGKEGGAGVRIASSRDGGASWGAPVELRIAQYSQPSHVQVALGRGGDVYVAWEDGTAATPAVLLAVSHDDGRSFAAPVPLSDGDVGVGHPVLAFTGAALELMWRRRDPVAMGQVQLVARTLVPAP